MLQWSEDKIMDMMNVTDIVIYPYPRARGERGASLRLVASAVKVKVAPTIHHEKMNNWVNLCVGHHGIVNIRS